jgi:pyruvate,water dikinase
MHVALSVAVQEMVDASAGSSGVMFTLDTESGFRGVTLINASYGLGEYVVKGRVVPDQLYVFDEGVRKGKNAIISRTLGTKQVKLVYGKKTGTKQEKVKVKERNRFSISDEDVIALAKWGEIIEKHYKQPQDIEWVKDGKSGMLYIVQARPETVKTRSSHAVIEKYFLKKKGKELLRGVAIGERIGAGKVRVIENPKQMKSFKRGDVLVTRITDPDWEPIMRIASAIITEQGGKTSHAAIVSRELGVPCIVGATGARKALKTRKQVTVSCAEGDEGIVYSGILPFEVKKTELKDIPKTKTKIMMNVGDPDNAFALSFLPHNGVGLARQEFIFSNFIRIHPLALVHYSKLKNKTEKKKIREMTRGYKNKSDYCVDKLAEGIGRIATAMYPNDVVLRLSDFKTNEYAALIGGKEFEPKEGNPMLGWRGASRYYSDEYKQAFALECRAIKKVREEWGLQNVIVMVPFCRTPEEGKKVLETMESFGLKRGDEGLQVYVMCEIPSNVILAEDFAKLFDGFSIGSNDLTQLTLGVDRDSALVSHIYDENSPAVKRLISSVIDVAHKHKRHVGICGQAPSDYPKFTEFLVRAGIDSISLNPDTVVETKKRVAYVEKTVGKTGRKTHKTFLSLVAGLGILGAALIGLGAGCSGAPYRYTSDASVEEGITPAMIREKATQKALEDRDALDAVRMATLSITDFASFEVQYPQSWDVRYWNGGVSMVDKETGEYVSIFRQVLGHPVDPDKRAPLSVDGRSAVRFADTSPKDESALSVVEIDLTDGSTLEINSNSDRFEDILQSFHFVDSDIPDRPLTHWDVREGDVCIQMITYARESEADECRVFATPCDIPDGWEVCDAEG